MMMLRERMGASLVYFVCEVFFWEIIFNVYKYITYIFMCIHHDDAPRARGRVCTWTYHVYVCTYIIMMLERVGMSLATIQMQEVHACDMTHSYMAWIISLMWHDASACVTWLIHLFVHSMTDLSVWSDTLICVTWLIHMCDMTHSYVWRDSFICVTWLTHMCDMTYSYVWLGTFMCATWLIHIRHASFTYVTWRIYMCDVTHLYAWRDSCRSWNVLRLSHHTYESVLSHLWMCHCIESCCICDVTHSFV